MIIYFYYSIFFIGIISFKYQNLILSIVIEKVLAYEQANREVNILYIFIIKKEVKSYNTYIIRQFEYYMIHSYDKTSYCNNSR